MSLTSHEESPRILVVDDEKIIREILNDFLTEEGFIVHTAPDGEEAIGELERHSYDLVISDLKMPKVGGLELLSHIKEQSINVIVLIMTGYGTVETAIEAMKNGAYDYILKPFKVEEVVHVVRRGLNSQQLKMENMRLKEALGLYRISEELGKGLSVEPMLELVADAALEETPADAVSVMLNTEDNPEAYEERVSRCSVEGAQPSRDLEVRMLLSDHRANTPVLAQGLKVGHYYSTLPDSPGVYSFCSVPLKIQDRIMGLVNLFSFTRGRTFTEGQRKMLSIICSRAAGNIENARLYENLLTSNTDLAEAKVSLEENFRQTIVAFALALEENDQYTRGHSERVSEYSRLVARGLGMSDTEETTVVQAALMHDIGKIGIRHEHLNKEGPLTTEEVAMFRHHPDKGKRILEPIPFLAKLIPGAQCHHEHFAGTGYPQGLAGDEIPLLGRIIAVADTYDAMTTDRAYRKALPHEVAVAELRKCAGTQFDPELVEIFIIELERDRMFQGLDSAEVTLLPVS